MILILTFADYLIYFINIFNRKTNFITKFKLIDVNWTLNSEHKMQRTWHTINTIISFLFNLNIKNICLNIKIVKKSG